MLNVTKELTALARKLGYTGKAPDTVAKAINAITASVGEGGSEGGGGCDCEPLVLTEEEYDPEKHDELIFGSGEFTPDDIGFTISAVFIGATGREVWNAFPNIAININSDEMTENDQIIPL